MSYSQYGEDIFIIRAVAEFPGAVLDIGAYHPKTFSNSRGLIEQGRDAVLVEPSPEPFLSLLQEYGRNPKVKLVNAAVGLISDLKLMQATADAVSTTDAKVYETWKNDAKYTGEFWTPIITLSDLFREFGRDWAFINIDTEGSSVDIFGVLMDHIDIRPRCICVEHDGRTDEVAEIAAIGGYKQTHFNGTNVVYSL